MIVNRGNDDVTVAGDVVGRTVTGKAGATRTAEQGEGVAVVNTGGGRVTVGLQSMGQVGKGGGGAGVAARVAGDPAGVVGGQDRTVQHGGGVGVGRRAEQAADQGVGEQRAARQRLRVAARGQVEGVEPHLGVAQVQVGPADRSGKPLVLVFGVDDQGLDAVVEPAQKLQLRQVRLARAGLGQDHGVVVRLGPAVPQDEPAGVGVAAQQHPARGWGGQLGGGERERCGQRGGVHGAAQVELVQAQRQGGGPALQAPEGGRAGVQQQRAAQRPQPVGLGVDLAVGVAADRDVQADRVQATLAAGQAAGQLVGVLGGGLHLQVGQPAAVVVQAAGGFQPAELAAQPLGGHRRGDGVDVQGDVGVAGIAGQRLQPAGADLAGVAGDREAAAMGGAGHKAGGADLERIRTEQPRRGR